MIRRVTDPDELTDLARACDMPPLDGSAWLERSNVIGWGVPLRGAVFLDPIDERSAEVHVIVHPSHRGKDAIRNSREAFRHITKSGVRMVGITPRNRRDALMFAISSGMKYAGETHTHFFTFGGA